MKIHVGCGSVTVPGYVNVDIRYLPNVDRVDNAEFLRSFQNEKIEAIYACHMLEHVNRWRVETVLRRWCDLLDEHGILYVAVPDFEAIVRYYNKTKDLQALMGLLYGGQDYPENHHNYIWDYQSMSAMLHRVGFSSVSLYDWQSLFGSFDDYSKCYLPHLDQENGTLMSLNIMAIK